MESFDRHFYLVYCIQIREKMASLEAFTSGPPTLNFRLFANRSFLYFYEREARVSHRASIHWIFQIFQFWPIFKIDFFLKIKFALLAASPLAPINWKFQSCFIFFIIIFFSFKDDAVKSLDWPEIWHLQPKHGSHRCCQRQRNWRISFTYRSAHSGVQQKQTRYVNLK